MTSDETREAKDAFLSRYNPNGQTEQAASDAVKSASQHNSLYGVGIPEREKARVRGKWKALLEDFASRYRTSVQTSQQYEADVGDLKREMNRHFPDCFRKDRHPRYKYERGFRISHAQKSLSVYLKYLWCMDAIKTPPQCPVDSRILEMVGLRYPDTRWVYVNSIEEHRRKIACLTQRAEAKGLKLAEWELVAFQEWPPRKHKC